LSKKKRGSKWRKIAKKDHAGKLRRAEDDTARKKRGKEAISKNLGKGGWVKLPSQ